MKSLNYILDGFGFENWMDFFKSSFGFISVKIGILASLMAGVMTNSEYLFGVKFMFMVAYVFLILLEWGSGVWASRTRGEEHKSRKLGRMIFKVFIYAVLMFILHQFTRTTDFPELMGFELNPFIWLYWIILLVIIWQLIVSLLENFRQIGWKWADVALKVINKQFYDKMGINDPDTATKRAKSD